MASTFRETNTLIRAYSLLHKQTKILITAAFIIIMGALLLLAPPKPAGATAPTTINFQGKVVNNTTGNVGTNVSDTSYSIVFRLYSTQSPTTTGSCTAGNNCVWEETDTVSTTNGVFQVELGTNCSFFSTAACNNNTAVDFSSNSLYLTMKFNGDSAGFMSPTMHFTGVPYAYYASNSAALGGLAASNFVQLAQGVQTDSSTTNASIAINKTGSTANILTLQKSSTTVLGIDNGGLISIQPAASLTAGQTALTQTITNASSTGGTVNGYSQTISVANTSSASTTNGFNISLTDNTALGNTNNGLKISLAGSNTNQIQYGIDISVNQGAGVHSVVSGTNAQINCGNLSGGSVSICGEDNYASGGVGVYGYTLGRTSTLTTDTSGAGVLGQNNAAGAAANFYTGTRGVSSQTAAAAYTAIGVYGRAKAGSGATTYGGYFALDSASSATQGSALYATNSSVAANILDLQDNTTSVFTVGDGGVTTLKVLSATSGAFQVQNSSSNNILSVSTSGNSVTLGDAGVLNGTIIFRDSSNSNTIAISTGVTSASYSLYLPLSGPGTSQCLQTDATTASQLVFGACSAGSGDSGLVNSVAVTDFNLQDVAGSGTITGSTWSTSGSGPTNITLGIANADATHAGAITNTTQTIAGVKTFQDFVILQPAASLTAGQTALTQTITNASSTGGTVNGYSQTITVANTSSASTTNGLNISLTDNASALANSDTGLEINLSGSNTNRKELGIDANVSKGIGIKAVSTGSSGSSLSCAGISGNQSIGICAEAIRTGAVGYITGSGSLISGLQGTGLYGSANVNSLSSGDFIAGLKGISTSADNTNTYTSIGVYGQGAGGTNATTYGGYLTLGSSTTASASAGLYVSNSTAANNIVQFQDNTTDVFKIADGGLLTASTNSASGFIVQDSSSSKAVLTVDTSGDAVLLGKAGASGLTGKLTFNNAAGTHTVSIVGPSSDPASSFTFTLPTALPGSTQCIASDNTGALSFSACAAGSSPFTTTTGVISQTTSTDALNLVEGQAGDYGLKVSTSVAPTVDLVQIINGNASVTDGVDGLALSFSTSNADGDALHIIPAFAGNGSDEYNYLNLDALTMGSSSGSNTLNGIKIGVLTENGTVTSTALNIDTGWDTGIIVNTSGIGVIINTNNSGWGMQINQAGTNDIGLRIVTSTDSSGEFIQLDNSSNPNTVDARYGIALAYYKTNASGAGLAIGSSYTGGANDARTYYGLQLSLAASNASGTDIVSGIRIDNLSDPGSTITSTALDIGSGWDKGINSLSSALVNVTSTTAFVVQGAANVLSVDTTNSLTNVQGINSVAALGTELIDNGGSTTCSGTNWSGSGHGPYTHTPGSTTNLVCTPPATVTAGATYQINYTISGSPTLGTYVHPNIGNNPGRDLGINSSDSQLVTATNTNSLKFEPTVNFDGAVTITSLKLVTLSNVTLSVNNSNGSVGTVIRSGGDGLFNTFIGVTAGQADTTGSFNNAIGRALVVNTTGSSNNALGDGALYMNTTGAANVAIGDSALWQNTTSNNNTAVGSIALGQITTGSGNNTAVGYYAGYNIESGSSNDSFLGYNAGYRDPIVNAFMTGKSLQNATALGYGSQVQQSNSLILGGQGANAVNVGIGTTSPTNLFSVSPDVYDTGTAYQDNGSAGVAGTTIHGIGTTWTSAMVGMEFIFASGEKETITAFTSTTQLTGSVSQAIGLVGSAKAYRVHDPAFYVSSGGFIGIQAAAALTGSSTQSHISQTLTNNQTGGTVNGLNQAITISNASGTTTTNGLNIALTDNASALSNTNTGLKLALSGSNTSQSQVGIDVSVANGFGIKAVTTGIAGGNLSCGGTSGALSYAICADANNSFGTGIFARTTGVGGSLNDYLGTGVYGRNDTNGAAGNFYKGLEGQGLQTAAAAYTSVGVYGDAKGGAGATTYGGYFTLNSGSGATAGAALYASNSSIAANIVQFQDNTADVFTIGDGGLTTLSNNSASGFIIKNSSSSKKVLTVDTSANKVILGDLTSSGITGALEFDTLNNAQTVTLTSGATSAGYTLTLPTAVPGGNNYCLVGSTSAALSWLPCGASSTATLTLSPEFAGAVLTADGTNNSGTMTSDFCGNDGAGSFPDLNTGVCNTSGDFHNYYNWTSTGANDYDIFVRWRVPSDFASFSTVTFNSKKSATGDDVKLTIFTNAGAACGTATSMTNTASAWQSTTYTISGCSPAAGDQLTLDIHMAVAASGNTVQMGGIPITYNRK